MSMPDENQFLRDTADGDLLLAASPETPDAVGFEVGPTRPQALSLTVTVPQVPTGTSPTLDVSIEGSFDGITYIPIGSMAQITDVTGRNGDGFDLYVVRFTTHLRFVRVVNTIVGTSADFGPVQQFIGNHENANVMFQGDAGSNDPKPLP